MSSVERGLYRAILHEPADDVHRLVYADWLDDHGQMPLAEFIRTQVRLASAESCGHPAFTLGCSRCGLRQREEALLEEHGEEWLAWLPGSGWKWCAEEKWLSAAGRRAPGPRVACFRRGFVTFVTLITWQLTDCAHLLVNNHPIERIRLSDRWPAQDSEGRWSWFIEHPGETPDCLPWNMIEDDGRYWQTAAEALHVVSEGCLKYGREYRGLFGGKRVFLVLQAAKICGVPASTVSDWFDSGRLGGYRIRGADEGPDATPILGGEERRIPREALVRFIREEGLFGPPMLSVRPPIKPLTLSEQRAEQLRALLEWMRPRKLFTTEEVARIQEHLSEYPVPEQTVAGWFDSGKLPGFLDGAARVVPRAALLRFLETNGTPLPELEG